MKAWIPTGNSTGAYASKIALKLSKQSPLLQFPMPKLSKNISTQFN